MNRVYFCTNSPETSDLLQIVLHAICSIFRFTTILKGMKLKKLRSFSKYLKLFKLISTILQLAKGVLISHRFYAINSCHEKNLYYFLKEQLFQQFVAIFLTTLVAQRFILWALNEEVPG